jgi:hypothetical protein
MGDDTLFLDTSSSGSVPDRSDFGCAAGWAEPASEQRGTSRSRLQRAMRVRQYRALVSAARPAIVRGHRLRSERLSTCRHPRAAVHCPRIRPRTALPLQKGGSGLWHAGGPWHMHHRLSLGCTSPPRLLVDYQLAWASCLPHAKSLGAMPRASTQGGQNHSASSSSSSGGALSPRHSEW